MRLLFAFGAFALRIFALFARRFGFAAQGFQFIPRFDLVAVEGFGEAFVILAFDKHHDFIAHRQDVHHFAFAFRRDDALVAFGKLFARFHVMFEFVNEAAAQASAYSRDFCRRERYALFLCHLDGDGGEVRKKFCTATFLDAARAHAADHFRNVARTDLPHVNVRVGEEIVHVFFEGFEFRFVLVLRTEQEGEARTVVVVFRRDDFDIQFELRGTAAAFARRFVLFGLPGLIQEQVARRGASFHGPPAAVRFLRRFLEELNDLAQVFAARSIHNDALARFRVRNPARVEVVDFSRFGKAYSNNIVLHGENYTLSVFAPRMLLASGGRQFFENPLTTKDTKYTKEFWRVFSIISNFHAEKL